MIGAIDYTQGSGLSGQGIWIINGVKVINSKQLNGVATSAQQWTTHTLANRENVLKSVNTIDFDMIMCTASAEFDEGRLSALPRAHLGNLINPAIKNTYYHHW